MPVDWLSPHGATPSPLPCHNPTTNEAREKRWEIAGETLLNPNPNLDPSNTNPNPNPNLNPSPNPNPNTNPSPDTNPSPNPNPNWIADETLLNPSFIS